MTAMLTLKVGSVCIGLKQFLVGALDLRHHGQGDGLPAIRGGAVLVTQTQVHAP